MMTSVSTSMSLVASISCNDFPDGLTSLTRLNLALTSISGEGLEHLMGLDNIAYLNLYGSQVSDAGLQHLAGMTNLRKLFLWQSNVTEEGAKKLQEELPDCEVNW